MCSDLYGLCSAGGKMLVNKGQLIGKTGDFLKLLIGKTGYFCKNNRLKPVLFKTTRFQTLLKNRNTVVGPPGALGDWLLRSRSW